MGPTLRPGHDQLPSLPSTIFTQRGARGADNSSMPAIRVRAATFLSAAILVTRDVLTRRAHIARSLCGGVVVANFLNRLAAGIDSARVRTADVPPDQWYGRCVTRSDYVLAVMAAAQGPLTPVQVQKLFFILDKKIASDVSGPHFDFEPYNYGPFDPAVYHELDSLATRGLAFVDSNGSMRQYGLTASGIFAGLSSLQHFPPQAQDFVRKLVDWIRSVSFAQLVSSVYEHWPEMRAKSIFRG
jgi:uncharacterized protein